MQEYTSFVDETLPAVRAVQAQDGAFYRMEKDFQYGYEQNGFLYRSRNDAMLLGYNGISHYSSSDKLAVKALVGALGFRNCVQGGGAYYYTGSTNFAASLLGLKYVLSRQASEGTPIGATPLFWRKTASLHGATLPPSRWRSARWAMRPGQTFPGKTCLNCRTSCSAP